MKKDKVLLLVSHLFIILLVFFSISYFKFSTDKQEMKFLELMLMVIYIYTFVTSKVFLNWLSSYMIFIYTLFLFNFTRIFLDLVEYKEFGWATKFKNYFNSSLVFIFT